MVADAEVVLDVVSGFNVNRAKRSLIQNDIVVFAVLVSFLYVFDPGSTFNRFTLLFQLQISFSRWGFGFAPSCFWRLVFPSRRGWDLALGI